MAGTRQPLQVLEANGRKHLTKAEKHERESSEVKAETPKFVYPPKWLPEQHKKEFSEISRQLIALGIFCKLDRDTLAAYLIARQQWLAACQSVNRLLAQGLAADEKQLSSWMNTQTTAFKQAMQCANALGLNITSRCRLVIPQKPDEDEEDPMAKLFSRRA